MSRGNYYSVHLSGARLRECYECAPARVQQYLAAEIEFVRSRIGAGDEVLELGCGYGRVALELARAAGRVVGIDTAEASIALALEIAGSDARCEFRVMDALALEFDDSAFDAVVCVQNGVCAFGVDPSALLREAVRVTRPGGRVLMSSYAEDFWPHRLGWFERQSERGLVGEIDHDASGGGVIVCRDGFRAAAMSPDGFRDLCRSAGVTPSITEVDGSSVFCEIVV